MIRIALVLALAGCSVVGWVDDHAKSAGGEIVEAVACPTFLDCGHVYLCEKPANNPLGHVEICVDDDDHPEQLADVEALYGACDLTPRHEGLCLYCCGPDCGPGANAFNGTYCPGEP